VRLTAHKDGSSRLGRSGRDGADRSVTRPAAPLHPFVRQKPAGAISDAAPVVIPRPPPPPPSSVPAVEHVTTTPPVACRSRCRPKRESLRPVPPVVSHQTYPISLFGLAWPVASMRRYDARWPGLAFPKYS